MKFRHLRNYDPTSAVGNTDEDQNTIQYRGSCYHRWINASKKTYSEVCKAWYIKQAESLMVRFPNISKSKPFPRRNRDGENEPESSNNAEVGAQNMDKETSTNERNKGADDVVVVPHQINNEKEEESKKSCDQDLFNDPLLASVGYEVTPVDAVVSRSKLPTDVVLTRLTMLELRGLVSAVPGGYLKIR